MDPVVMGDPEQILKAVLAGAADTIDTGFPSGELASDESWIQLDGESSNVNDWPVTERSTVRVVCHLGPGRRTAVKALASQAMGICAAAAGGPDYASLRPVGGRSGVAVDPATKNVMVWFLVRVNLTAQQPA